MINYKLLINIFIFITSIVGLVMAYHINQNELNRARLHINDLIDELELKIESSSEYDKTVLYEEFYNLKQIEDEIFNLYVEEDEGEQIKQSVG